MESEGGGKGRGGVRWVNILEQMLVISVSSVSAGLSSRVVEDGQQCSLVLCVIVCLSSLANVRSDQSKIEQKILEIKLLDKMKAFL